MYIIRIFKLYLFWLVLNFPFVVYDGFLFFKAHGNYTLLKYILTCIFSAIPGYGISWYLVTSMFAAFLLGRMYMKFSGFTLSIFTFPFFLVSVFTSTYGSFIHSFVFLNSFISVFFPANSVFSGLFFFALGMYLFERRRIYIQTYSLFRIVGVAVISFIGMVIEGNLAIKNGLTFSVGTTDQFFTLVPFTFFLVVLCFKIPLHLKYAKIFRGASTVTYLSQFIFILGLKFSEIHFNLVINEYLLAMMTICGTFIFFIILYYLQSKKYLSWIRFAF